MADAPTPTHPAKWMEVRWDPAWYWVKNPWTVRVDRWVRPRKRKELKTCRAPGAWGGPKFNLGSGLDRSVRLLSPASCPSTPPGVVVVIVVVAVVGEDGSSDRVAPIDTNRCYSARPHSPTLALAKARLSTADPRARTKLRSNAGKFLGLCAIASIEMLRSTWSKPTTK